MSCVCQTLLCVPLSITPSPVAEPESIPKPQETVGKTLSVNGSSHPQHVDTHVTEAVRTIFRFASSHFDAIFPIQLRPLHEQMQCLKLEFEKLKLQVIDTESLRTQVKDLAAVVEGLKTRATNAEAEVHSLRECFSSQSGPHITSANATQSASRSDLR
jgi:hypothetical protein